MLQGTAVNLDDVICIGGVDTPDFSDSGSDLLHHNHFFTIYFSKTAGYNEHHHGFFNLLEAKVWHVLITDAFSENSYARYGLAL